jgi:hypothetical protein
MQKRMTMADVANALYPQPKAPTGKEAWKASTMAKVGLVKKPTADALPSYVSRLGGQAVRLAPAKQGKL